MAEEEKSEYFHQLICLVVDLGTDVLLKFFKKNIPSGQTVESFLQANESILKNLHKKKILNDMQMPILKARTPDEKKFDISLLFILIRNLLSIQPPNGGWSIAVTPSSDKSEGASLMKLKDIRNQAIAHRSRAALKKSEFEQFWNITEDALVELAKKISPEETRTVEEKIKKMKGKPVLGDEKSKLDALLKWDLEEKFNGMAAKMDVMTTKVSDQTIDIGSMKEVLNEVQEQLKQLGLQGSPVEGSSRSSQVSQMGNGSQESEMVAVEKRLTEMQEYLKNCMNKMYQMSMFGGAPGAAVDSLEPPIDHPRAFTSEELIEYSRELGSDWEIFTIYLGFRQVQIDALKDTYVRQIETLLKTMLEKWHNVVARCPDEDPKKLLAAAFCGIRDNRTAAKILGGREYLKEVKDLRAKDDTLKKIHKISFEIQPPRRPAITYPGGHHNINVYPGATFQSYGPIVFHPYTYGGIPGPSGPFFQPTPGLTPNICRAEGVGQFDGNKTDSGLFKSTDDGTLPQNVVDNLNRCMRSVGCLVVPHSDKSGGTVFRVGSHFVVTCLHVVESIKAETYSQDVQINQDYVVPAVFVNFNESPDIPAQTKYRLHPPCFYDTNLDIALLEIVNQDSFLPPPLPLNKSEGPRAKVSVIGYGHPGSTKKHLEPSCRVLNANSEQVLTAVNMLERNIVRIQQGLVANEKNPNLVHDAFSGCDDPSRFLLNSFFEHGGSGGPAIDHSDPSSYSVVGVYTRGYPTFFFDLPLYMRLQYPPECRFEMCTRTSSLYDALKVHNQSLAWAIFG